MKKIVCIMSIIGFMASGIAFSSSEESLVVGIIEFEEKTSIGQENAAIIIPEILIDHFKKSENISLQNVCFLIKLWKNKSSNCQASLKKIMQQGSDKYLDLMLS